MTSKKKKNIAAAAARGGKESKAAARLRRREEKTAKEKHRMRNHRRFDPKAWADLPPLPHGLNAKLEIPKMKTKHQVYLEFAENTEKKKKLETTVTTERDAPPGFEFVPIGDPEMTTMCKEISREQGAMIFIVSSKNENALAVYDHVDRIGFHFRETIVDQARELIGQSAGKRQPGWNVEKIPESQDEINRQTDAAIRDLFPRIPNTDRAQIIQHGFQKGKLFNGKEMIGLQPGIPLARRVQLATLAHIRHTHTRYDLLLKETTWENARRAVEPVCLDFILKWRGDEETGRDQMDEILREVVVITDSEDDEEDEEDDEDDENSSEEDEEVSSQERPAQDLLRQSLPNRLVAAEHYDEADMVDRITLRAGEARRNPVRAARIQPGPNDKKAQRGFSRYQAAYNEAKARQQGSRIARSPVDHQPVGASRVSISSPHPDSNRLNHGASHGQAQTHGQSLQNHNTILDEPYHKLQRPLGLLMPTNGDIVRHHSERIMHYQDQGERTRIDSPAFRPGEPRLPSMIRRTPPRRGLQDMLVRSVESPSSDIMMASPRQEGELVFRPIPQPHDTYQRRVADGRISPQRRQVIIVDDDSPPQFKRRRVVREGDSGHFRLMPSGEPGHHDEIQQSRPSQGLYRSVQPIVAPPAMQAPPANGYESQRIFSVPARGIYRGAQPEFTFDRGPLSQRPESFQPVFDNSNDNLSRQSEHRQGGQMQRPLSPRFPVSSQSGSCERNTGSVVPDQTFINRFSQTRLEYSQNDEVSVVPLERHRPNYLVQSNDQRGYGDEPVRSFATAHPPRARSPVQYIQRPLQYRAEPSYYGQNDHRQASETIIYHEQGSSSGAFPLPRSYATKLEPRRQVVVID